MVLAITPTYSLAGFYSGNELVELMREYDKSVAGTTSGMDIVAHANALRFQTYVCGVYDATEFLYNVQSDKVTRGQIAAIASKYLKNHPERWSEPAASLVIKALIEAFPLNKSK